MKKTVKYLISCIITFVVAYGVIFTAQSLVALPNSIAAVAEAYSKGITDEQVITQISQEAVFKVMPYCVLVSHICLFLVFAIWFGVCSKKTKAVEEGKKQIFTVKYLVGMLLIAVGTCYFLNFGMEVVYPIIPENIMEHYIRTMEQAQVGINAITIFASVFLAPVGEELVFRGVMIYYGNKAVEAMDNKKKAFLIVNIIQAFFFGFLHMNLVQGSYAFFMGLILGYLVYRFKSILPSILVHFTLNALSTFTAVPIMNALPKSLLIFAVLAVVFFAVFVAGMYLIKEKKEEVAC